jgi:hypothetical protein
VYEVTDGNGRRENFEIDEQHLAGNNVVPPGIVMSYSKNAAFTLAEVTNIRNNAVYCFVWGLVTYYDGFGNKRLTRFCHRYNAEAYRRYKEEGFFQGKSGLSPEGAKYHQWGNEAN